RPAGPRRRPLRHRAAGGDRARRTGRAAREGRLRRRDVPADRGDVPPARREASRADEADGLSRQHRARPDRGRGGAGGRPRLGTARGRRARRVRAGAGARGRSAAGPRKRHPGATRNRPDGRALPARRAERLPRRTRYCGRTRARVPAQPGGASPRPGLMAKLIYSAIASLDGHVADEDGNFDWAEPDEEVHAFVNELERPVATYLYGRRMYEVMVFWETAHNGRPVAQDFAQIWRAADKIVYSRTLEKVSSARTRIEREF